MVESRLRGLTNKLEAVHGLVLVHPFVEGFDNVYTCTNHEQIAAAVNGVGNHGSSSNQQQDTNGVKIYTRTFYIGLYFRLGSGIIKKKGRRRVNLILIIIYYYLRFFLLNKGLNIVRDQGQIDISRPISEFKRYVRSWEQYNEQHMGVVVKYLRRSVCLIYEIIYVNSCIFFSFFLSFFLSLRYDVQVILYFILFGVYTLFWVG